VINAFIRTHSKECIKNEWWKTCKTSKHYEVLCCSSAGHLIKAGR